MKKLHTLLLFVSIAIIAKAQQRTEPVFYPPTPWVKDMLFNDSLNLVSFNHSQFRIYCKADSYAAGHLPQLKAELDMALSRIKEVTGIANYTSGLHLVAMDSEEQMQEVTGLHVKGMAIIGNDMVVFVYNDKIRPQFKHEIGHYITHDEWGEPACRLLDEGFATYTDNQCFYDNPIYSVNAYMLKNKKLVAFNVLINDFDNETKKGDVVTYLQSAGIVKYLNEKYGLAKFKQLWTDGFGMFETIYGFSVQQLEKDWLAYVGGITIPQGFDWEKLMKEGCG